MAKNLPSSKSGQSPKVDSHAQAMSWSKSHVGANNTRATGSQSATKTTQLRPTSAKLGPLGK